MKSRPTQFGARENTASSRRHASRLAVDSLPSKSEAIPRGSQHRQPTPGSTYRASESNMSIITMPLGGPQEEKREIAPKLFPLLQLLSPLRSLGKFSWPSSRSTLGTRRLRRTE